MTRKTMIATLGIAAYLLGVAPVRADCRADLTASAKNLQATQAAVVIAADKPDPGKCEAYRRHYAAMIEARAVFARCDKGAKSAEHAGQLNASIDGFKKAAPRGCKL